MTDATNAAGQMIGGRYRLERVIGGGGAGQGSLWLARDLLAADGPAALRRLGPEADQVRARQLWARLQGVLHPQVPRFGAVIQDNDDLWLAREWQTGRTYRQLLEVRRERQLVFGCGEVLLLLRQLLPVLAVLHGQELLHGDLTPDNLLRRDSDGLPVLLDFGLLQGTGGVHDPDAPSLRGGTAGYAPPEQLRGQKAEPWMDLHALGVVAMVLISGDEPADLLDPVSMEWVWPAALESEAAFARALHRMVSGDAARRFTSAGQALAAFQALEMPESTGPVPRADRTEVLVPPAADPQESAMADAPGLPPHDGEITPPAAVEEKKALETSSPAEAEGGREDGVPPVAPEDRHGDAAGHLQAGAVLPTPLPPRSRSRQEEREAAAEGGLWPVLVALVISAVAGTAFGWWWLGRQQQPVADQDIVAELPDSLPPGEVDQRQLLLSRLRALRVNRAWFLSLVDASLLAQYPERRGRLPSDSLEDAPLRRVWNELAEEWMVRVEQLPMAIRTRLGSYTMADWERRQARFEAQGLSSAVLRQLVSANAVNLLPGQQGTDPPQEPFRQLWYAVAEQTLDNLQIEPIQLTQGTPQIISAMVPGRGARVFPIRLPEGHSLVLGANGTPLLQMSVFDASGNVLESRGSLRVANLGTQKSSPVQLLISNEGVAAADVRLQLRADPPIPEAPAVPEPPSAPQDEDSPEAGENAQQALPRRPRPTPDDAGSDGRPRTPVPSEGTAGDEAASPSVPRRPGLSPPPPTETQQRSP